MKDPAAIPSRLKTRRSTFPGELDQFLLTTEGSLRGQEKPDEHGLLQSRGAQALDIVVSRANIGRAMSIMRAFLNLLHRSGHGVRISEEFKHPTFVQVDGEEIRIRLREGWRQKAIPPTPEERRLIRAGRSILYNRRWDFKPSGVLAFEILGYYGDRVRKRWTDGDRALLRKRLPHVVETLRTIAASEKADRERRYREQMKREEQEQRALEERRHAEADQKRVDELVRRATRWEQARVVRLFLSELREKVTRETGEVVEDGEVGRWFQWAEGCIHRIDPIGATVEEITGLARPQAS